jgi:hypothetical protein
LTLGELATGGDIQSAGGDSYEITSRGKTALARAERDGAVQITAPDTKTLGLICPSVHYGRHFRAT